MSIRKIWKTKETIVDELQIKACGNNRLLAILLKNRSIETEEDIYNFLNPLKYTLSSPDVFVDMEKTIERIKSAIKTNENITVYGDFDADGITSTALLFLTLKKIGANVDYYLPDRGTESHGLNTKAIVKIIAKRKSKLIITVDCGITNVSEVNFAKGFNTDIIITDHHEAPDILPEAFAIINPKAQNALQNDLSLNELKSLNYLAGVGVAFKLACKLLEEYNCKDFVHEILPLAAIGTIGDVVELIGENRTIVTMGLELIKNGKHKGIQKLLEAAGITDLSSLTSENIAFGIVPRINASGRLESPESALKVLISEDISEIDKAVKTLNDLNALRQEICDETFEQAKKLYEENKNSNKKSIILLNDNWHIGIIGIVASKLVETYNKPVFLMTRDANNPNIIRCSSRSISQMNIYEVLSVHKECFEGFGGHKMAAGFSFDENKIKFTDFKNRLNTSIEELYQDVDFSKAIIEADTIIEPEDITIETIEELNKMQPFGAANPSPLFVMNNLTIKQFRQMGQNNKHLKLILSKNNSQNIDCVKWNTPDFNLPENSKLDILFVPQINIFNGNITIQYMIEDIHSEYLKEDSYRSEIKILDHRNKKDILQQVLDFINSTKKKTGIFIKSRKIQNQITECEKAVNTAFDIENIPNNIEQLMFFECPLNKNDFIGIINHSNAEIIHLMNFNTAKLNTDNYISTISGMLKYAISNLNGEFEIIKLAKALSVDNQIIENTLNLFEETNMIELSQIDENKFKVTNIHPIELSKIKQNEIYSSLENQIEEINEFQEFYMNASTNDIKELLKTGE